MAKHIKEATDDSRSSFSGKLGFILAAAASAVGLGNLWRFPYLAAQYGGGLFLLVYLVLVVTFGFTLMLVEVALGRKTRLSAVGAFRHFGKKFAIIGILACAVPFIIMPYYSLIGGWVTKYTASYLIMPASEIASDTFFTSFITGGGFETYLWMYLFIALVMFIIALGVQRGIEKSNKVLMPLLILMLIGISVFSCMQPGALDGLAYYLVPDFSKMSVKLLIAAMGQMFFSLSLAMGIMVTYGSYFKPEENLEQSVRRIEVFDTGIAILAGLMIIPASFAALGSGEAVAENAGPSLMFIVLPGIFSSFGDAANVLGFAFFLLVFFAALTSCISIAETLVSIVADGMRCTRRRAIVTVGIYTMILATVVNMGYNTWIGVDPMYTIFGIGEAGDHQILDFMDFLSNTVLMPVVALLSCIFVGWIVKPKVIEDEVERNGETFKSRGLFRVMIKFIAPVFVIVILVGYIMDTIGVIHL